VRVRALVVVSILFISMLPVGYGSIHHHGFRYVDFIIDPKSSSLNITINTTEYFRIEFTKLYIGSLNIVHFPRFWYGDLRGMNYTEDMGKNAEMGYYYHIRMWKNLTLKRMILWGEQYHASVYIDFYVASKNYTKSDIKISKNTLRYDVKITTDCPGDFVYLDHRVRMSNMNDTEIFASSDEHLWEIHKNHEKRWLNSTFWGGLNFRFEKDDRKERSINYTWSYLGLEGVQYLYWDGYLDISFVFHNTGTIVQDPYIELPVPILTNISAEKVINYIFEHTQSLAIGVVAATALIVTPLILRRIKL